MTDDLVKFLRTSTSSAYNKTAADRIEQLAATCEELERRNAEMNLLYGEVKDGLEAKLAKAVEALREIGAAAPARGAGGWGQDVLRGLVNLIGTKARATLAELEGK